MRFVGKTVLVAGASSGIGQATAQQLGREGATVICSARRKQRIDALAAEIIAAGGKAHAIVMDLAQPASIEALFEQIGQRFDRLDGAFNNAGVDLDYAELPDISMDNLELAIGVNFRGNFLCMMHEARMMRTHGAGVIVNTASVAGVTGLRMNAAYVASKHAVVGMTKGAALDMGPHGIRVNCICPGSILTEMTERNMGGNEAARRAREDMAPLKRMGRPDEMSDVALWLLSDQSTFVTGAVIHADGGVLAGLFPPSAFSESQLKR